MMLNVMFNLYLIWTTMLLIGVQLELNIYLDTNLMHRIGSTRLLNNISEVDNDTTKGVVTWVLIGLYFKIAMIVSKLSSTPKIAIMRPIEPAKSAATSEKTNSWDVFDAYSKKILHFISILSIM